MIHCSPAAARLVPGLKVRRPVPDSLKEALRRLADSGPVPVAGAHVGRRLLFLRRIASRKKNVLHVEIGRTPWDVISPQSFREAFLDSDGMAYVHDLKGILLDANRVACAAFGSDRKRWIGTSIVRAAPPDAAEMIPTRIEEIIRFGRLKYEGEHRFRDGTVYPVEVSSRLVSYRGRPAILGVVRNIARRRAAERAAQANAELFLEIFQHIPCGVAIYRAIEKGNDFIFVDFNPAGTRIEETPRERVIGRKVTEVFPGVRDLGLLDVLRRVWRTGMPEQMRAAVYRDERHTGWRENFVTRLSSGDVMAVYEDVSERMQIEQALVESESRHRALVETAQEGIWVTDSDGGTMFVNARLSDLLGFSLQEMSGRPIAEFLAGGQPLGGAGRHELALLRKDGRVVFAVVADSPLFDLEGHPAGALAVVTDITDRKKAEEALRRHYDLEKMVAEISTRLAGAGPERFTPDLEFALHRLGMEFGLDRCFIALFLEGQEIVERAVEWKRPELAPIEDLLWRRSVASFQFSLDPLHRGEETSFRRISDLPSGAEESRRIWTSHGVRSLFSLPLMAGGRPIGFLALVSVREERVFSDEDIRILRVLGETFAGFIERIRARRRLEESEERYRRITASVTDYIYSVRLEAGRAVATDYGPGCVAVTGYTAEEMAADPHLWIDMVPAEDQSAVRAHAQALSTGADVPALEHRIVCKNGEVRWVRNSAVPHRSRQGDLIAYDGIIGDITDRKRAEKALLDTNVLLESTMEQSPISIVLVSMPGFVIRYYNSAAKEFLGVQDEPSVIGQSLLEFRQSWRDLSPVGEPIPIAEMPLALALQGKVTRNQEFRARRKDGTERWELVNASPIYNPTGELIAGFVTFIDITERKQMEQELRETSSQLSAIYEGLGDGVLVADLVAETIIDMNDSACRMFGYSRDVFLRKAISELHPPREREKAVRQFRSLMEAGGPRAGELRCVRADGTEFWAEVSAQPVSLRDRPCLTGIFRETTDRREAAAALRESEEMFRSYVEQSLDGVALVDEQGAIVTWNSTIGRIWGRPASDVIGKQFWDVQFESLPEPLRTPERLERNRQTVLAALSTGQSPIFNRMLEAELAHSDGTRRFIEQLVFPIRTSRGIRIGSVTRDITDRRQAEAEIQKLNAELEQRVALRTAQLETANRELEALAYSISHDLRAPLRTLSGFSRMLEEDFPGGLGPQAGEYIERIQAATRQMGSLIDDMLGLARLSRSELHVERLDLTALAGMVARELAANEPGRRVDCRIEDGITAWGDERLLQVVLENLLGNAWKFTAYCDNPRVDVGTRPEGGEVAFFVRDNGAGFDPAYTDKLFRPFQRLHAASEFSGNGIGLASVQRIIHRHGGRVWATGEPGKGAEFCFTLPSSE